MFASPAFIIVIIITFLYIFSILRLVRKNVLDLFELYTQKELRDKHRSLNEVRTIHRVLEAALLPVFRDEFKDQLYRFILYNLQIDHFLLNHLHPPSLYPTDKKEYSTRFKHLLFGFAHFLGLISIIIMLSRGIYNKQSIYFKCSRYKSLDSCESTRSFNYCVWDEQHSKCEFNLVYSDSHPTEYLYYLTLVMYFLSLVMVPVHLLFSFLSEQMKEFYDFYLFIQSEKYSKMVLPLQEDVLVINHGIKSNLRLQHLEESKDFSEQKGTLAFKDDKKNTLIDFNDELRILQSNKNMLLRAIRLSIIQKKIDFVRPSEEASFLLNKNKLPNHFIQWKQTPQTFNTQYNFINYLQFLFTVYESTFFNVPGNPHEIHRYLTHTHISYQPFILQQILHVRSETQRLKNNIMIEFPAHIESMTGSIPNKKCDYDEKDIQILQWFFVYWFTGFFQDVLQTLSERSKIRRKQENFLMCLYGLDNNDVRQGPSVATNSFSRKLIRSYEIFLSNAVKLQKLALMTLYWILIIGQIVCAFEYSDSVGDLSLFLSLFFGCNFVYLFFTLPLISMFYSAYLPKTVEKHYLSLYTCFRSKFPYLLRKKTGYLKNAFATIQFFHPVVRLARFLPESAISRVLMTLSDYDLPATQLFENWMRGTFSAPTDSSRMYQEYSIHQDIWSNVNPLCEFRLSLLWDNWQVRILFLIWICQRSVVRLYKLLMILFLKFPVLFQVAILELVLVNWFYGSLLLILHYWRAHLVYSVLVLLFFCFVAWFLGDFVFGWSEQMYQWNKRRTLKLNENVLKYKNKKKKKFIQVTSSQKKKIVPEDNDDENSDELV